MKLRSDLPTIGVALFLLTSVAAYFATRDLGTGPATAPASRQNPLVDDRMVETARRLSAVADTVEEQDLAREALELADHELDQAFAFERDEGFADRRPAGAEISDMAMSAPVVDVALMSFRICLTWRGSKSRSNPAP